MRVQRTRRLAWNALALSLAASAAGLVLSVLTASTPQPGPSGVAFDSLFDIDAVLNRTLVYGLLTASLGAVYVGSVLLLQLALDAVTSGRYDAALTLKSFSARPREQVDLDALGGELRSVMHDTMQPPAQVSVWLRGPVR